MAGGPLAAFAGAEGAAPIRDGTLVRNQEEEDQHESYDGKSG